MASVTHKLLFHFLCDILRSHPVHLVLQCQHIKPHSSAFASDLPRHSLFPNPNGTTVGCGTNSPLFSSMNRRGSNVPGVVIDQIGFLCSKWSFLPYIKLIWPYVGIICSSIRSYTNAWIMKVFGVMVDLVEVRHNEVFLGECVPCKSQITGF